MRPILKDLRLGLAPQRGHLSEWVPVCLAIGIGAYFSVRFEPSPAHWLALVAILLICAALARRISENWRPLAAAVILVGLGALLAGSRAHYVAGPVLNFRYYGPIEGRIVHIDRSASDAVRLTLDRVALKRFAPGRTPRRVRVSMHGTQGFIVPEPGLTVILTGHLSPPPGPVEPGGFDFQRQAWFKRLGAIGYTRTPVLALAPASSGKAGLKIARLRRQIADRVQTALPGDTGAFAAAITTGDRTAISRAVLEHLRASNLAHLLAISGLHMGLLTGFVFAAVRYGLASIPPLALRWPVRKIAAISALFSGATYLALSGGNVATVRAFIMVSVMLVAVLLDRRAVTLRAVAVAATIVLVWTPEALMTPGFQMSFAATTALVAAFGALRGESWQRIPRWVRPVLAVFISSAIAGAATAPVAAAHFNRIADYGLLANLLAVPVMGLIVMPAAVLAALLSAAGLAWIGLGLMGVGINWILFVARLVAELPGARTYVPAPPEQVLPLIALGALFLILWRATVLWRAVGIAPIALGFVLWAAAERPPVLISETGGLVGLLTSQGRAVSKAKGEGFAAKSWLENDGDAADQKAAFVREGMSGKSGRRVFQLGNIRVTHLTGRGAGEKAVHECMSADVVIASAKVPNAAGPCLMIDAGKLRAIGAAILTEKAGQPVVEGALQNAGARLWNSPIARAR